MRKIYATLLSLLSIICFNSTLNAQAVSGYVFGPSSGTYTALTGATTSTIAIDDDGTENVAIGFNFVFGGVTYTNAVISTNGAIKLAPNGTTTFATSWTNNLSNTYGAPIIAPMWDDNNANGGSVVYVTSGIAPNRTFSVEWINTHMGGVGSTSTPTATFQLTLTETLNSVKFVYGTINPLTSSTISIGLNDLTSFLSVTPGAPATASSITANNGITSATNIPSGTIYTFSPPPPCVPGSLNGGSAQVSLNPVCPGGNFLLSVTGASFGTGLSYQWESSSDNLSWGNVGGATSATLTTSITTSTYFRRKMTCVATDAWSASVQVNVSAPISTFPWSEDFNSITPPALPGCAVVQNVNGGPTWGTVGGIPAAWGFSAPNALQYLYSTTTPGNDWFFTPGFVLTGGTQYRLQFKYGATDPAYPEKMKVMYGTLPNAASMTSLVVDYPNIVSNAVAPFANSVSIGFTPAISGTYFIGFQCYSDADEFQLFLDDLVFDPMPACLPPTGVAATSNAPTTANLSWLASASNPTNGYEWEVRSSGAAGSGATGLATSGSTGAGVLTALASGLTANTTYSVYVRANCGGIFSAWTTAVTVTTLCNPVSTFPWSEDFNSITPPALPSCMIVQNVNGGPTWGTVAGTPAAWGFSTPNTLRYLYSATTPGNDWIYTPGFTLTGGTQYRLQFKYGATDPLYPEKMKVMYGTGPNAAAMTTLIVDYPNIIANAAAPFANSVSVGFTPAVTGTYYIGFQCYSDADEFQLFLDDLIVDPMPACVAPTGAAALSTAPTTANLSWVASTSNPTNGYEWEVRSSGAAGSGATGLAASGSTAAGIVSAVASGLTANTTYSLYVRANCGGIFSAWTNALVLTTACNPLTTPFTENFGTYATVFPPACWTRNNPTYLFGAAASANGVGVGSARFDFYDANAGITLDLVSQLFTPVPANYRLVFHHAYATFSGEVDQLQVFYSTDGGATYSSLSSYLGGTSGPLNTAGGAVGTDFTPGSTQWAKKAIILPTGTNRLRFRGISGFGNNLYLDSIKVEAVPQVDVGISKITLPTLACPTNNVFFQATVKNYNNIPVNFATTPVAASATISGAASGSLTTTLNSGTLAPDETREIYLSPSFNFTVGGLYNIAVATTSPLDLEIGNDTLKTSVNINPNPVAPVISPATTQVCLGSIAQMTVPTPASTNATASATTGTISVAVPDGVAAGVINTLNISGIPSTATITSISVTLNMTHAYISDMAINLKAPNGTNVLNLFNQRGGSGDNLVNTVINSTSTTVIPATGAPYTGTYAPSAALGVGPTGYVSNVASFGALATGATANGAWELALRDYFGIDAGILTNWSITINYSYVPALTWSPVTSLFTNAAATTAYAAGTSAYSIYVKPAATGTVTYTATATGQGGCTAVTTTTVTTSPVPAVTVGSIPDTVCISDQVVTLNATPGSGSWSGTGVSGTNFIPPATAIGAYVLAYSYTSSAGCTGIGTKSIVVKDCPERIVRLSDNAVILFPNPNSGQFNIRVNTVLYNKLTMRVYTNGGLLVSTQQLGGLTWGRVVPIDLTNLPGGVYMVKFSYDGGIRGTEKTFKVMIGTP